MKLPLLLFILIILFISCNEKPEIIDNKLINPYYDKAFDFREKNESDSAFFYFNEAKDLFTQRNDSLGVAKCLVNMSIISSDKGDYFGSQELSISAISYFNEKNIKEHIYIKSNLNNLGIAFYNLKNYSRAIEFYEKSIQYTSDKALVPGIKNNIANAYRRMKQYEKSLSIYVSILKQPLSKTEYAKVLSNYTFTAWLTQRDFNAAPGLLKALKIRKKEKDSLGLNSSYSHLADYYINKQPDSALQYAKEMFKMAKSLDNRDDEVEALQKIIRLSPGGKSKEYFERYDYLSDSLQTSRRAAGNQFALIRYETEKSKADNLVLQKDNDGKRYQIIILLFGILLIITIGVFWYRKRKQRLQQEKEIEVKKTELKYVKKIHDHVANKVYQVMNEIDNTPEINKDELAGKLDVIYKISRDLSYEKELSYEKRFALELSKMLYSYASAKVDIQVNGNDEEVWEGVADAAKDEVMSIIQELMTNMVKHSKADTVSLSFERNNGHVTVLYADNGKGIEEVVPKNGLKNTETRIKSISGVITFETGPDNGLNVKFSFPVI